LLSISYSSDILKTKKDKILAIKKIIRSIDNCLLTRRCLFVLAFNIINLLTKSQAAASASASAAVGVKASDRLGEIFFAYF
jgi:hypothetical protein